MLLVVVLVVEIPEHQLSCRSYAHMKLLPYDSDKGCWQVWGKPHYHFVSINAANRQEQLKYHTSLNVHAWMVLCVLLVFSLDVCTFRNLGPNDIFTWMMFVSPVRILQVFWDGSVKKHEILRWMTVTTYYQSIVTLMQTAAFPIT